MSDQEQPRLIEDEITEETETREVLVPLAPHEVLEIVDQMAGLNEELKSHRADEEQEKARHKEAKETIQGRISSTTADISKLIDQAGMRKRKSLEKTIKKVNHSTKMVEWIWNDQVVDSRPMVAAEFQMKLIKDEPDNIFPIGEGEAGGVDPSTMDETSNAKAKVDEREADGDFAAAQALSGEDQED